MERDTELLLRVARMYYIQSETMEAIAHHMGVSRSTVSRLLKEAKDRGLVRVTITDPDRPMTRLAEIFRKNFHVQAHLVNVRPGSSYVLRLEQVAKVAARLLDEIVTDNDVVGVAWGTTVSAVAQHLRPRDLSGVTVVSLNGGANHRTTGLPYVGSILQRFAAAFHGEEQFLALPAFFDNPGTRTAMWAERSTRHMLQVRASACLVGSEMCIRDRPRRLRTGLPEIGGCGGRRLHRDAAGRRVLARPSHQLPRHRHDPGGVANHSPSHLRGQRDGQGGAGAGCAARRGRDGSGDRRGNRPRGIARDAPRAALRLDPPDS